MTSPHSVICIRHSSLVTRHSSLLLALAALMLCAAATADTLYLRAGEQESGRLDQITQDAVVFQGRDGAKMLPKSDVIRVQLQRPRLFDEVETAAQVTDPDLKACLDKQPSEKDFPADGSVTLLQRRTYDLTVPGVVKEINRFITKILRLRGEEAGSVNVMYFDDTDAADVDFALTVTPDGRVLHLSDSALKDESIYASLPDYRRLKRLRFACKEPRPGSILDVQYTVTRKRDTALEPFYAEEFFQGDAPILRKEIRVITPGGPGAPDEFTLHVLLSFEAQNAGKGVLAFAARPARQADRDVLEWGWTLERPAPGIVSEPLMPPRKTFAPSLTLAAPATWKAVSDAYAAALAQVQAPSDALKAKAVELAKKGGTEAIYNSLARGIRTAPVPHLQYRMTPHAAEDTARRGLANELDKNFLYLKMLEAAGIECAFALVRDRSLGPLSKDVPSPRAFNRSAVYIVKEKRFSTVASDRIAYGTLPGELQDAPALVLARGKGELMTTPRTAPPDEAGATQFDAALDRDGNLDITATYTGTGNAEVWMRSLKDLDEQQMRNQLEQMAASLHPAAALKDYKTTDLADLDAPPSITIRCAIPGFAFKAGDDLMLLNLPGVSYEAGDVGRPTREHDLFWLHAARTVTTGAIHLPEGFKVYSLPKNVRVKSPVVASQAALKAKGNTIAFKDVFELKVLDAPPEAYPDYKRCQETRANLSRQRIILTRDGPGKKS